MGTTGTLTQPGATKVEEVIAQELSCATIEAIAQGRDGNVYAAVRSQANQEVYGLVVITHRDGGWTYTKPVTEDMGPVDTACPTKVLDVLEELAPLPEPADDEPSAVTCARNWRAACRATLAARNGFRGVPHGAIVRFGRPAWGERYGDTFAVIREDRKVKFRTANGTVTRLGSYTTIPFEVVSRPDTTN